MPRIQAAIIGGGVAGAAFALSAARRGLSFRLLEQESARSSWRIGETLAAEARQVLMELGVWSRFLKQGHLASPAHVSAWGGPELQVNHLLANPHGNAWQLDRIAFEEMLLQAALETTADAKAVCWDVQGLEISRKSEKEPWLIRHSQCDEPLEADWLVDATGRRSEAARRVGSERIRLDSLVAVHSVANPVLGPFPEDEDASTHVESRPEGWWYSALTPRGHRVFSLQTNPALVDGQSWRTQTWLENRLAATGHIKTLFFNRGRTWKFPPRLTSAHSSRLTEFCGPGWLAIGDAAMSFDPLSGQGLLKALSSVLQGIRAVQFSQPEALRGYADWCEYQWSNFLTNRESYYGLETRWPQNPFWAERGRTLQGQLNISTATVQTDH